MHKIFYIVFIFISFHSQACFYQNTPLKNELKNAIISGNIKEKHHLSEQLKSSYSKNELQYYRTQLSLIKNHSVLITNGLEDTYPLTILQETESISTKTIIVSLELLNHSDYLVLVFDKLKLSQNFDKTSKSIYLSRLLKAKQTVYISNTVNPNYYSNYKSQLFLEGLSLKYNSNTQLSELSKFWNKIQSQSIDKLNLTSSEKELYSNYLPPLLTLYKLKLLNKNQDKILRNGIILLAKLLNKDKTVTNILKQYENGG